MLSLNKKKNGNLESCVLYGSANAYQKVRCLMGVRLL